MVYTSKTINRNFLIKASGIDNEGKRINKLVGRFRPSFLDWRNINRQVYNKGV